MNRAMLIDNLLTQYQQERTDALMDADRRRMEIAKKAPLIADLPAALAMAMREAAPKLASDPDAGRKAVYAIKAQVEQQLRDAGATKADLEPRYRCPLCKDTGYVGMPVKRFCDCFTRRLNLLQLRDEDIGIPDTTGFEYFDLSIFPETGPDGKPQRDVMRRAREWAETYCNGFSPTERRSIVFYGQSGLGKTYLLDCMVRRLLERGFSAMKVTAFRLGTIMRQKHIAETSPDAAKYQTCAEVDLLAIDDLGTEPMLENVTVEYLYALLAERMAAGKPIIITSNLNLAQLEARYTERVMSRLTGSGNVLVKLSGQDVRQRRTQ